MDEKVLMKSGIRKIGFALVTQALILGCSLVTSLIVPKYMEKEMYGHWQIYYFYLNYINFITLGYNDGIVLKYGGMKKEALPLEKIRSGNLIILLISIVVSAVGLTGIKIMDVSADSRYIFSMLLVSMPFVCVFNIILSLFLAINEQEKYNIVNFLSRFLATVGYCVLLMIGMNGYVPMIRIDFAFRVLISIVCIVIGIHFLGGSKAGWRAGWCEVKENCLSGIFITMGALCASFAPLAGRVVLEHSATISEYAVFSFAMSILSLVVTFTNAAGMVFFPMLKKLNADVMPQYYSKIKNIYNYLIYGALFCYIPAVLVIENYLTEYRGALGYAYLVVAICIPLGKMQILITPYMKAYRLEKEYFIANLISAVLIWLCDSLVYRLSSSVLLLAMTTLIVYELWSLAFELYLKKKIGLNKAGDGKELLILLFFIAIAFSGSLIVFVVGYCCGGLLLTLINRKALRKMLFKKNTEERR